MHEPLPSVRNLDLISRKWAGAHAARVAGPVSACSWKRRNRGSRGGEHRAGGPMSQVGCRCACDPDCHQPMTIGLTDFHCCVRDRVGRVIGRCGAGSVDACLAPRLVLDGSYGRGPLSPSDTNRDA